MEIINKTLDKTLIIGFILYAVGAITSLAAINVGLGLALLSWIIKKIINLDFKLRNTPLDYYILAFIIAILLSLVDSVNLGNSMDYVQRLLYPVIIYYLFVNTKPRIKIIKAMLVIIAITMVGSMFYGLWQHYVIGIHRVNGSIFVMEFASLLSFFLIYLIVFSLSRKLKWRIRLGIGLLAILSFLVLVYTGTRGVWIALVLSMVISLFLYNKKYLKYYLIVMVIILVIASFFLPNYYTRRFTSIIDISRDRSNVTRLNLWRGAFLIYRDNWINGIGLNNFEQIIQLEPYYNPTMGSIKHAHNNFLQLAAELGTLGLVSFVLLITKIIKLLYNYYRKTKGLLKLFFLANLGVFISYISHGLTEYNLEDKYTTYLVWFLISISYIVYNRWTDKEDTN